MNVVIVLLEYFSILFVIAQSVVAIADDLVCVLNSFNMSSDAGVGFRQI